MASFYIKSLFTNIYLEETVSIATDNYFNITRPSTTFTPKLFKDLLLSSVKDIIFLFNSKVFSQIDGVGMGTPLGPTFANLFLCHHETKWLDKCPLHFNQNFTIDMLMILLYCFRPFSHSLISKLFKFSTP